MKIDIKPPKGSSPEFRHYWNLLIVDIKDRPNFCSSHLMQFKVLVDSYVEYDELLGLVKEEGRTLISQTSQGINVKANPNLTQLNRTIAHIKDYSKMLELTLAKDQGMNGEDEEEWS